MSFDENVDACKKVLQMSDFGSEAQKFAEKEGLSITNVSWEDNARFKNSSLGPCISDVTLNVNNYDMPIIREPNFTDTTCDIALEKIPLIVGNEKESNHLKCINLKEYLQNFHSYITNHALQSLPSHVNQINLLSNDLETQVFFVFFCWVFFVREG